MTLSSPSSTSSSCIVEGDDAFFSCYFWKAEGDAICRPLLFVLFCCNKKKKVTATLLPLPSFSSFFWKAEGDGSCHAILFVLFCCNKKKNATLPSPFSSFFCSCAAKKATATLPLPPLFFTSKKVTLATSPSFFLFLFIGAKKPMAPKRGGKTKEKKTEGNDSFYFILFVFLF